LQSCCRTSTSPDTRCAPIWRLHHISSRVLSVIWAPAVLSVRDACHASQTGWKKVQLVQQAVLQPSLSCSSPARAVPLCVAQEQEEWAAPCHQALVRRQLRHHLVQVLHCSGGESLQLRGGRGWREIAAQDCARWGGMVCGAVGGLGM